MIHTATLLHDDVVDESMLRRGHATANAAFGNSASVLVGDFLYSRAFQLMVGLGSVRMLEILSNATNVIAEGEVLQLMNAGNPDIDEAAYLGVIRRKTAKLFEAAARLGAVLARLHRRARDATSPATACTSGTAFQLVDDILDYSGDLHAIGKNLGDDLAEGKMTLPLIRAIEVGNAGRGRDSSATRSPAAGSTDFEPVLAVLRAHRRARARPRLRATRERRGRGLRRRTARLAAPRKSARISVLRRTQGVLRNIRNHRLANTGGRPRTAVSRRGRQPDSTPAVSRMQSSGCSLAW